MGLVIKNGIVLLQEGWWLKVSRLAANNIFTTVLVSLLTVNISFRDSGYVILYPQPRFSSDRYLSFTGYQQKYYLLLALA